MPSSLALKTGSLLAMGGTLVFTAFLNGHLKQADTPWSPPPESLEQTFSPEAAKILSLGHLPSWVDALLLKSYSDPAYDPVAPGTHPPLFYLLNLATQLDPHFIELYFMGGSLLSIVRRDGEGSQILLDRAHEQIIQEPDRWPIAWQLELFRGYNALFELGDYLKAREAFEWAAKLNQNAEFLSKLTSRLETTEGRFEIARHTFESLLQRKNEPEVQKQLENRKTEVDLAYGLFQLDQKFSAFCDQKKLKKSEKAFVLFTAPFVSQGSSSFKDLLWDEAHGKITVISGRHPIPGLY